MIELIHYETKTMTRDERLELATHLCTQIETILDGICEFQWQIGDGDDYELDGQPDDQQENEDFAQDGTFDNMEPTDDGFWS